MRNNGVPHDKSVITAILSNPIGTLLLALVITVSLGFGLPNLYFRGDYKVFFDPENTQRVAYETMQDQFSRSENIMFLVQPHNNNVLSSATLSLIKALTEASWQLPLSTRVESLTNFQFTYADNDDLVVEDLVTRVPSTKADTEILEARIKALPELYLRLINASHTAAVVDVTLHLPDGDATKDIAAIVEKANEIKAAVLQAFPEHDIALVGVAPLNNAFSVAAQKDAETLVPAMFVVILLMVMLLTGTWVAAVATLLVILSTIISTLGIAGWYGIYLSTATVNVPTMVTTLAVADCVHIVIGAQLALRKGLNKFEAIRSSVRSNFKAVLITSVTTAAGFLTLNFSEVPILTHLGNLTAIGVMLAFVLSVILLPALLMVLPFRAKRDVIPSSALLGWAEWVIRYAKPVLTLSLITFVLSVWLASQNQLNDVVVKYFNPNNLFRQAVTQHENAFGGMSTMDFAIDTGVEQGATTPEVMQSVRNFVDWLREQPETLHVLSLTDILQRLNMNMNNDDISAYQLPYDKESAAQYLLLYEMSLPFGLDVNNQINMDKSAMRVIVTLPNLGSNEITALELRAREKFRHIAPELSLSVASPALMFAHIGEQNMNSMVKGTLLALVLISLLIWLALSSTQLGAVSLVTNLIPAACGFALWALISGQINMALSVVLSMTMGIIVDDTVHFLAKYQVARRSGLDPANAIKHVFSTVGIALSTTTLALMAGFGVLTASSFVMNAEMGLLTVIIIACALIIDFLFLPALLMIIDKPQSERKP